MYLYWYTRVVYGDPEGADDIEIREGPRSITINGICTQVA